jgi:hypothetical protein
LPERSEPYWSAVGVGERDVGQRCAQGRGHKSNLSQPDLLYCERRDITRARARDDDNRRRAVRA